MSAVQVIASVVFPLAMAFAAISDVATMTISNRLSLALAGAFVILAPFSGMDLSTIGMHFAAAAIVLVISFACFSFGWIGGGDAKFATVTVLWLGWASAPEFIGIASIFGGILTVMILGFRQVLLPAFIIRHPWVQRLHQEKGGVPYGVALAAAGLAVYPHTAWMTSALT